MGNEKKINTSCFLCGADDFEVIQVVDKKPEGETDYGISLEDYYREICQCRQCRVFFNRRVADLLPTDFYEGQYNTAISSGSIQRRFQKIIQLPFSNSDNKNRVLRIVNYLYSNDLLSKGMKVLDVGSGTSVFQHEMKKFGFETYCVDPDPAAVDHAKEIVQVNDAFASSFDQFFPEQQFDLITFNKVLEHVEHPQEALKKARTMLGESALIYVELPDGERTTKGSEMINRSEFYIDHHTTFTRDAFIFLAESAGFRTDGLAQIVDPSGKNTIFGFLTPQ